MNRFVSYNDIGDEVDFKNQYPSVIESYLKDSIIINNEDMFYYLNDKDVVSIDGVDISMYLLINTLLSDVLYEHVIHNLTHHVEHAIRIIKDDKEAITYNYNSFRKIVNRISIEDLLHYFNRILGDIPVTTTALLQSRLASFKLNTRYQDPKENKDVGVDPLLDEKIMEALKPELSDMELVIALYIRMCRLIDYDKDSNTNYVTLTDNVVNKNNFMSLFKFYLTRVGIDYELDNKGNVVIKSGEYTVDLENSDMTLGFDIVRLTRINGLVPHCEDKISDTKFKEMTDRMLADAYTEAKNEHDSQAALERYSERYLNCHLSITEKLQVFLNKIARKDVNGRAIMPYYNLMFKRIFKNDDVELIYLNDLDEKVNLCNNAPYIVIKIHCGDNRYVVINPNNIGDNKIFDENGYQEYLSNNNFEIITKRHLENGENYVRQVTKKS